MDFYAWVLIFTIWLKILWSYIILPLWELPMVFVHTRFCFFFQPLWLPEISSVQLGFSKIPYIPYIEGHTFICLKSGSLKSGKCDQWLLLAFNYVLKNTTIKIKRTCEMKMHPYPNTDTDRVSQDKAAVGNIKQRSKWDCTEGSCHSVAHC